MSVTEDLHDAEARVRELEAALQQSRDDHQGAVEKLRAVEALADEWDGAADHGEDERYGRIIARTLRGCADDLRKRLGPRLCPKCGGAASWHGDEWSCYGECTGYGRLASPVESDADAEGAS
jgi:ribosomal protein S27AE